MLILIQLYDYKYIMIYYVILLFVGRFVKTLEVVNASADFGSLFVETRPDG